MTVAALLGAPCIAPAAILTPQTVDGPSADVLDLGGVAMADDGSGGAVYRRREDGRAHIYVAAFTGTGWNRPRRVDVSLPYESTWPRIAASSRGRLLVTWAQPTRRTITRTIYSLYAAWKAPGDARFSKPTVVDPDVGDATGLYPTLAVAANGGSGYLTYARTEGDVTEFRLAQFRGGPTWSRRAIPRRSNRPLRRLDQATAPKVAVDAVGNAVVGYIEPDQDNVDRVYVRRVFSGDFSLLPLQASPGVVDGRPVTGVTDEFALGIGGFGEAIVAMRQQVDVQSAATRVFVNTLPPVFSDTAGALTGARPIDPPAPGIPTRIAAGAFAEGGGFRLAYGLGSTVVLTSSPDGVGFTAPVRVGTPGNTAPGDPRLVVGAKGSGAWARRLSVGGREGVEVREIPVSGQQRRAQVASARGGLLTALEAGGSGAGDALVAFRSESGSRGEITAVTVDAPPLGFAVTTPTEWVRPAAAQIAWDPARNTLGRVRYEVFLNGTKVVESDGRRALRVPRAGLQDGSHRIQIRAIDRLGQRTTSNTATLRIDATPPRVTVRRFAGGRVQLRIFDAGRSGLDRERSRISWGDGRSAAAANVVSHRYRSAGRRTITATVRDRAGNRSVSRLEVVVR
jgi:hypothetical protein